MDDDLKKWFFLIAFMGIMFNFTIFVIMDTEVNKLKTEFYKYQVSKLKLVSDPWEDGHWQLIECNERELSSPYGEIYPVLGIDYNPELIDGLESPYEESGQGIGIVIDIIPEIVKECQFMWMKVDSHRVN